MNAEVVIKFKIENVCKTSDLERYDLEFDHVVRELIESEGLFGVASDDFEIISIKEKK